LNVVYIKDTIVILMRLTGRINFNGALFLQLQK